MQLPSTLQSDDESSTSSTDCEDVPCFFNLSADVTTEADSFDPEEPSLDGGARATLQCTTEGGKCICCPQFCTATALPTLTSIHTINRHVPS